MTTWALLMSAHCNTAFGGVLQIDPEDPPAVERRADGTLLVTFPGVAVPLPSDDAAVVSVRPGHSVPERLRAEGRPLGLAERHWRVPAVAGEDAVALALRWLRDPAVSDAIPDVHLPHRAMVAFDDPSYPDQWYLESLGMEPLWDQTQGDPAIRVAVLDSGTDIAHPDLAAGVVDPFDAVDGDDDPSPVPGEDCLDGGLDLCDGHGTAVSGIVGARANNGTDLVGMCPECALVPIRIIGEGAPVSSEVAGFEHAIEADAAVMNNSWGFSSEIPVPGAIEEVIRRAATETRGGLGSVVVFAAGNEDRKVTNAEMVGVDGVLCVSAMDRYHLPTGYTNFGPAVDVAAFSATVSLAPGGGLTTTFGGTSAAAPVAAGLAAWTLAWDPTLSAEEVIALLTDTAHQSSQVTFDERGHDDVFGYGELDPAALLARLRGGGDTGPAAAADRRACGCASAAPGLPGVLLALLALCRRSS